jgi:hypothetical protein
MCRPVVVGVWLAALLPAQDRATQDRAPVIRLEGSVVDAHGKPIADAAVRAFWSEAPWPTSRLLAEAKDRTDGRGHYTVGTTQTQSVVLQFAAPGCCTTRYQDFMVATTENEPLEHVPTIQLAPAAPWTGRVRGPDGKPLADATVTARALAANRVHLDDVCVSDAEGIFHLRGTPRMPVEVTVEHAGCAPVRLLPFDRQSPLDVTMPAAVACTGRVRGGQPSGFVYARCEDGELESTKTGADGSFRFELPVGMRYRVQVRDGRGVGAWSDVLEGAHDGVELVLPDAASASAIEVTAKTTDGRAVPSFWALFRIPMRYASDDDGELYLNGLRHDSHDGVARWPVDDSWQGKGRVLVHAQGLAETIVELERAHDGVTRATVVLPPGRSVRGVVRDADGRPVAEARVWHFPRSSHIAGYSAQPFYATRTAADGSYVLDGLGATDYVITAEHPQQPEADPIAVSLRDGDAPHVDFAFAPRPPLRLTWDHEPKGTDWLLDLHAEYSYASGLPRHEPGTGRVRAHVDFKSPLAIEHVLGSLHATWIRLVPGPIHYELERTTGVLTLDPPRERLCDLRELQTGRVVGRVDLGGLDCAERLLVRTTERYDGPATTIAADGTFALELLPGQHELRVIDAMTGLALATTRVTVARDAAAECDLALHAGIVDLAVAPPPGAACLTMPYLLLREAGPTWGREKMQKQIGLHGLGGELRLVLPAGSIEIGFQRARGALAIGGGGPYEETEMRTIEVTAGAMKHLTLQEPPRRPTAELAAEH